MAIPAFYGPRARLMFLAETEQYVQPKEPPPIPEGSMRVAPGTDAVVWRINPDYSGEL